MVGTPSAPRSPAVTPIAPAQSPSVASPEPNTAPPVFELRSLSIHYGDFQAIREVSMNVAARRVTAIIGPSGCGKSTLLRALNRMNDFVPSMRVAGQALYHGDDIYARGYDAVELRQRVGMVFQKPNPFPKSIYKNVAWGATINGYRGNLAERVEQALRSAALWDEVKDKLHQSAFNLSGGQQQRLCIARAIAVQPDVLLMDEPCSALDPIATSRIEDLIVTLKSKYTVVLVTHNMLQAARVSDSTAFMYLGQLVEFGETSQVFTNPRESRTQDYITGRFG